MTDNTLIRVENLTKKFGRLDVLNGINAEIREGEVVSIIGPSGGGKSTFLRCLNLLEKPTSGEIIIDGIPICDPKTDLKAIRRMVGLVFQYPEYQLFEETVYRDIAFGPTNMQLSDEEIRERVYEAAELVGLSEKLLEESPFELSGGQKRRAAIAGVLSMRPRVLILDEPTAGLDPRGRDQLLNQLVKLHEKNPDMTVLLVSHSMEDVARVAEHVFVLEHGSVALSGTVPEVFSQAEQLKKIGLSVPQITELFLRLNQQGAELPDDIYTVSAAAEAIKKRIGGGQHAE